MIRLLALAVALALGCSSSKPTTPTTPVTAPATAPATTAPAVKPTTPPAFPTEVPALATAEAIGFLPDTTTAVAVASSLDGVASTLADTPVFERLTGLAPAGLSRTRPIGIAFVDGREYGDRGWLAFAYVDDVKAFDASVPANRRARRGELAFIADSAATLRELRPSVSSKHELASVQGFRSEVEALHVGALLSWWARFQGAAGISVDGATLRFRAIDGVPRSFGRRDRQHLEISAAVSLLIGEDAPAGLIAKRDRANKELVQLVEELESARDAVVDDVAKQLGLLASPEPVERTFAAPAPTVKSWLAPLVDRWLATPLQAKVAATDRRLAALEQQVARSSVKHDDAWARRPRGDLQQAIAPPSVGGSSGNGSEARLRHD